MKKIAVFILCFSLLAASAVTAHADEPGATPGQAVLSAEVPSGHIVTMIVPGEGDATLDGKNGSRFEVERQSEPVVSITIREGYELIGVKVLLDGEDITDRLNGLELKLPPVRKDEMLEIIIETKKAQNEPSPAPSRPKKPFPSSGSTDPSPSPGGGEGTPGTPDGGEGNPDGGEGDPGSPDGSGGEGETPPSDSQPDTPPEGGDNPATGIVSGVSTGAAGLLALVLFGRKRKEK